MFRAIPPFGTVLTKKRINGSVTFLSRIKVELQTQLSKSVSFHEQFSPQRIPSTRGGLSIIVIHWALLVSVPCMFLTNFSKRNSYVRHCSNVLHARPTTLDNSSTRL